MGSTRPAPAVAGSSIASSSSPWLYVLDLDCPFAWPERPSYPISSTNSSSAAGQLGTEDSTMVHEGANGHIVAGGLEGGEPVASTSKARLELDAPVELQDGDVTVTGLGDGFDEQEEPQDLQEAYWNCLYCSGSSSANEQPRRFRRSLERARKSTFRSASSMNALSIPSETQDAYIDQLRSLTHDKLDKLDLKWHTELPSLSERWTREHEALQGESPANGADTAMQPEDTATDIAHTYQAAEVDKLKQAWQSWLRLAEDEQGQRINSPGKRSRRQTSIIRDKLAALETAELQMQILVTLELLSILPIPSYLSARRANHRRHVSGVITQDWLSMLRAGTPQRKSDAGARKRKKGGRVSIDESQSTSGPVTASSLTTPRQSVAHPPSLLDMDTIAEEACDEAAVLRRQAGEALFKNTARLLDAQTDNLAIQQTVSGAIQGLSLSDLMGETDNAPSNGLGGGGDAPGDKQQLDSFQSFWLEVVEERYADLLPADILSGCHSKFFLNALDPSASALNGNDGGHARTQSSPFHHPTPNLRQLAQSVQLANLQAEKNAIPQSPTLKKLLAAKEPVQVNAETRSLQEDVSWLVPPPPAGIKSTRTVLGKAISGLSRGPVDAAGEDKRQSSGKHSASMLQHRGREVEFGKSRATMAKRADAPVRKFKSWRSTAALAPAAASATVIAPARNPEELVSVSSRPAAVHKAAATNGREHAEERISKRKSFSPKKMTAAVSKGKTLVLATPSADRVWKSGTTAVAEEGRPIARPPLHSRLHSFDEEGGYGVFSDDEDAPMVQSQQLRASRGMVLVGETPSK